MTLSYCNRSTTTTSFPLSGLRIRILLSLRSFVEFRTFLKHFLYVYRFLVCKEISPRYGNYRIKVFFSTVVTSGRFITNLLIIILTLERLGGHFHP